MLRRALDRPDRRDRTGRRGWLQRLPTRTPARDRCADERSSTSVRWSPQAFSRVGRPAAAAVRYLRYLIASGVGVLRLHRELAPLRGQVAGHRGAEHVDGADQTRWSRHAAHRCDARTPPEGSAWSNGPKWRPAGTAPSRHICDLEYIRAIVVRTHTSPPPTPDASDPGRRDGSWQKGAVFIDRLEPGRTGSSRPATVFARWLAPELADCLRSGPRRTGRGNGWDAHLLAGSTIRLGEISTTDVVTGFLTWDGRRLIDDLAPDRGRRSLSGDHAVELRPRSSDRAASELQEMFGAAAAGHGRGRSGADHSAPPSHPPGDQCR